MGHRLRKEGRKQRGREIKVEGGSEGSRTKMDDRCGAAKLDELEN